MSAQNAVADGLDIQVSLNDSHKNDDDGDDDNDDDDNDNDDDNNIDNSLKI